MEAKSPERMQESETTAPDSSAKQTLTGASSGLFSGLQIVSLCTLLSRVLGLIRDIGMAMLFGNGVVMDAFSVAFRIPNLSRRLFGEGALTTAFLPGFIRDMEQENQASAWKLVSAVLTLLVVTLCCLVLLGELLLWGISLAWENGTEVNLLIGLTAVMLPYLILICLAAQVSAVLHAFSRFTWPALLPSVLNLVWIAAICRFAPWRETQLTWNEQSAQVYFIAGSILVGGCLQLLVLLPTLFRLGFHYDVAWRPALSKVTQIGKAMVPIMIGLSVTQVNVIADSLIAWGFSQPEGGPLNMNLPGSPQYPVLVGTASALYYGQRMYQFPVGVFGVALGTVLYPLLSRHAERGRLDKVRDDLSLGLRLVICIGLPASAGLVLLAEPLTALLFQHGAFDADDARQTVGMISAYGAAVWAYCGLLIVHRGYYAVGDRQTPLGVGLVAVVLNLALNLTLIWFVGGRGLAMATAFSAIVQVIIVTVLLQSRIGWLNWQAFRHTLFRAMAATLAMSAVCLGVLNQFEPSESLTQRLLQVLAPLTASMATYFAVAKILGMTEVWLIFRREKQITKEDD
jgi:putative peptidoglycan lipid II flippase